MDNQPQLTKPTNKALWIVLIVVVLAIAGYGVYAYVSGQNNENTNNANTTVNTVANTNSAFNTNTTANVNSGTNTNVATNTNIDTSGWKLYKNNELGFSVNYPANWFVGTRSATNTLSPLAYLASSKEYIDFYINGETNIQLAQEGFKIKLFVDNGLGQNPDPIVALKTEMGRETLPLINEKFLTINSIQAYRALRQIKQGEKTSTNQIQKITRTDVEYTFLYNTNLYRIWLEIDNDHPDQIINIFDNVANTFKLI